MEVFKLLNIKGVIGVFIGTEIDSKYKSLPNPMICEELNVCDRCLFNKKDEIIEILKKRICNK